MSKSSWSDSAPNLEVPLSSASEPPSREAQTDLAFIYSFLFRFTFVAAIFLFALLMARLAR